MRVEEANKWEKTKKMLLERSHKDPLNVGEMLTKFYNMLDEYEGDPESPDDLGYGINDEAIVNDPKWDKVRQYAKLVYEEITGEKA